MKESVNNYIKEKLSPASIVLGLKNTLTAIYQAVMKGWPLAIVGFIVSYFFAWWGIAVVTFFYAAFKKELEATTAFGICLAAGVLLWSLYATYLNLSNDGLIGSRIGTMLTKGVGNISNLKLIELTGLIGGLIAAMGGVTGVYAREMVYDTRLKFGWKW
jgi:hypothetical protein